MSLSKDKTKELTCHFITLPEVKDSAIDHYTRDYYIQ